MNLLKLLLRPLMRLLFRVEVHGDPSSLYNPRTLVVANHESFIDGLLIGLFLPVNPVFVVHSQIAQRPLFAFLLKFVDHLAVDAASPLAIKHIVRLVESGRPVVIFPEGRITRTGALMKVYDGAGFVAAKTGATIVPVRIAGAAQSYFGRLAGLYPRHLLPKIDVHIRPRRDIPMPQLPSARLRRRRAGEQMRHILLDMLVTTRPSRTLYQAFLDARRTFGNDFNLAEDLRMQEESFGSILKMSLGMSRLLARHTAAGEHVGVLTPNAAPTLGLIMGLSLSGRIPALLNYTAGADSVLSACTAATVKTVVSSRAFVSKGKLDGLMNALEGAGLRIIYLEDLRRELTSQDKLWIAIHYLLPGLAEHKPVSPWDSALVLFTSGSEGKPKGVVHSHDALLANIAQIRAVADFTPRDKIMMALPLFHAFGLTCGALLPLVSGCKVFLYPNPLHYRVIPELIYDRDCTVLFGTSTFLANYAKFAHPYDFGRLRYVVAGAERLKEEVRRSWQDRFGIRILEGYGITECAPVVAVNVPMACQNGTVGQLLPGLEYQLEAVPGVTDGGTLLLRGPNLLRGYLLFDQPGVLQQPPGHDGWYNTGDIVEVDDEGYVHIRGRLKRFAKIAGEMVSLETVEDLARRASPDCLHASTSVPDAARGEIIILFSTDPELDRERLLAAARARGVAELAVPRKILPIDTLPLLGSGKTDYQAIKRLAEEGAAGNKPADEAAEA